MASAAGLLRAPLSLHPPVSAGARERQSRPCEPTAAALCVAHRASTTRRWDPQSHHRKVAQWSGKEHLGNRSLSAAMPRITVASQYSVASRPQVQASLFGVGAPEALVVGVVALIVFGPKGLAEVARNLGKTLRSFQPTIKELQEVTREFRDTLQQEIGLDDLRDSPSRSSTTAMPPPPAALPKEIPATLSSDTPKAYSAEEMARITEEQLKRVAELNTVSEEARRASELAAWKGTPPTVQAPPPPAPAPAQASAPALTPAPAPAPGPEAASAAPSSSDGSSSTAAAQPAASIQSSKEQA